MRLIFTFFVFISLSSAAFAAEQEIPFISVDGHDKFGSPIQEKMTYVEGNAGIRAAKEFLASARSAHDTHIIVTTDDQNNEALQELRTEIDETPAFRFTFVDGATGPSVIEHSINFVKNHPAGVFMASFQTAISSYFYIHFSTHSELLPLAVTIAFTAIQNFILTANPSIWFPVEDITKEKEGRLARWFGVPTQTAAYKLIQDITLYTAGQVALSVIYHTLISTHPAVHGLWGYAHLEKVAVAIGLFNAFTTSSVTIAIKKLRRSPDQPLDNREIDYMVGLKNIVLAALLPEVYRGNSIAIGLTTAFGIAGWYTVGYGEEFIPKIKGTKIYQKWKSTADSTLDSLLDCRRWLSLIR